MITIDPRLPVSTCLIRTGNEQALMDAVPALQARGPAFAEDAKSLAESVPFLIRFREASEPIRCEVCGTPVMAVPESPCGSPRRWQRAIWEPGTWRKHTMRRCCHIRDNPGQQSCRPAGQLARSGGDGGRMAVQADGSEVAGLPAG